MVACRSQRALTGAAIVKNAMDTYSVGDRGWTGPHRREGVAVWASWATNAKPQNVALVIESFRDGLKKQGKL